MDWLDLLVVQGILKSRLQHHSSKASILWHSALFTVQLSHPCVTTRKTTALTRRTLVSKVMSLLLNMRSRLVIIFLPRSKRLLISWLQSPSAVPAYCSWFTSHIGLLHSSPNYQPYRIYFSSLSMYYACLSPRLLMCCSFFLENSSHCLFPFNGLILM